MFNQTRAWIGWVQAVAKWRFYVNMYDFKEWLAVNGIVKFKRVYNSQDLMRLGLLANLGVYTPPSYSVGQYNALLRKYGHLKRRYDLEHQRLLKVYEATQWVPCSIREEMGKCKVSDTA